VYILSSEINQLWSEDVNITFFVQHHSNNHDSVCEPISDFSYEDQMIMDLKCYDGYAHVGIFVYFDNDLILAECEQCNPPGPDEQNVVAYYFEVGIRKMLLCELTKELNFTT
jgi:hypothetical protein